MASHVCPWWAGYFLINPLRKIYQSPVKILSPYVKPGMNVLEIGPGMGYFSLWMAETVGMGGKIVAVDVQEKMIQSLKRRAAKAGVEAIIDARVCGNENLGIDDLDKSIDFCLAFAVVHEIDDAMSLFTEIRKSLKRGATCLLVEPRGHVSRKDFESTVGLAIEAGLTVSDRPAISRSRAALLRLP
jgi:ubiquinone/menaquinone biosynthesis C-methylase UbiE